MNLRLQRRLAARVLKCGVNRVRFNFPEGMTDEEIDAISGAISRDDVRDLAKRGYIYAAPKKGTSRGRARIRLAMRRAGRGRGPGSRKGAKYARTPRKHRWVITVRALRATLRGLRDSGKISKKTYRSYYMKVKGGMFKSRAHMVSHMVATGDLDEEDV